MEKTDINIFFEFRFEKEVDKHNSKVQIRTELTNQFLNDNTDIIDGTIEKVELYPVQRAGNSMSETFYMDITSSSTRFDIHKKYVAKFQSKELTEREFEGAKDAEIYGVCSGVFKSFHISEDLGVIVYKLTRIHDHTEFRTYFLNESNSSKNCADALKSIYESLLKQHQSKTVKLKEQRMPFKEHYNWYLERPTEPVLRIENLKKSYSYPSIVDIAKDISFSNKKIFDYLDREDIEIQPFFVHGDLHARNLMISKDNPNITELIDFDWVHYGDPSKDFTLMEATLKYMLLSELLQNNSDKNFHLPLEIFREFELFITEGDIFKLPIENQFLNLFKNKENLRDGHLVALSRVYESIRVLRRVAGKLLVDNNHIKSSTIDPQTQYIISNFLITLGISAYKEVEPIGVLIGLEVMGKNIVERLDCA